MKETRRVYMDHSATTPVDPRVVTAMAPYRTTVFGNSESTHAEGVAARSALERARQNVAHVLDCYDSEVVFTGSGTEADNLAIRGAALAARRDGRGDHIITTPIEHPAVGHTVNQLSDLFGFRITRVPVDEFGMVDPDAVAAAIGPKTILVSVMMANNEVGSVQRIFRIGQVCREREVLFHTDAVQAPGRLPLEPMAIHTDFLAISAHKFYGPKGVGALFVRRGVLLIPPITGAGHERGLRPGTVDVAGAVGLATALQLAESGRRTEAARLRALRDRLIEGVLSAVAESRLTGHPRHRLYHHASFAFRGVTGQSIVEALDQVGIEASAGAACHAGEAVPSSVLEAMGLTPDWSRGGLRLTLGRATTEADVDRVLAVLPGTVERLRGGA